MSFPIDDHDDDDDEAFERALFARRARAMATAPAAIAKGALPDARAVVARARAARPRARLRFEIGAAPFVAAAAAVCLLFRAGAFDGWAGGGAKAVSVRHGGGSAAAQVHTATAIARDPSAGLGSEDELASVPDPRDPLACWANDGPASVGEYASRGEHVATASVSASACVAEQPAALATCRVE
jgi:hypothetical protein